MRGSIRDLQNIRTGISNYLKTLARSANSGAPNNLLVSDSYLLNFLHEINGLYYKVRIFQKNKKQKQHLTKYQSFKLHKSCSQKCVIISYLNQILCIQSQHAWKLKKRKQQGKLLQKRIISKLIIKFRYRGLFLSQQNIINVT